MYASSISNSRSASLESYMNGSHIEDDPHALGVDQYPCDLESDSDENPCDAPGMFDSTTRGPRPESLSRTLNCRSGYSPAPSHVGVQKSSAASIDTDSPPHLTSLRYSKISISEYGNAASPTCDVDEFIGRFAEVTNHRAENYLQSLERKLRRLFLTVAFRTYGPLRLYMPNNINPPPI
ncbi:uncharacterized protein ARMOST_18102 [Armillaria ostoyae]|uniref:Uncharacterized protein n=1 Tax=Armillaria ostoyae TaxID=47428 RepID=A0A284S0X5_ARMOS|nr:uncharacterized protein ARMOST_18102 [Armillaria ostoyae]